MAFSDNPPPKSWKPSWHLVLIFSLLSGGILILGYLYYQHQVVIFQKDKEGEINAIADLKVKQIIAWRQERMGDAGMIYADPFFAMKVWEWFAGKAPPRQREEILARLEGLKHDRHFERIVLFDIQGRERLATSEVTPELLPVLRTFALEAMRSEKIVFTDLYLVPKSNEIKISIAVPFHYHKDNKPENSVFVGAVVCQIDPHNFIYPVIQSWPTPSKSGELVMIRRDINGQEIVYLNELRHLENAPLALRKPLTELNEPAVRAALGQEGIVRGLDYRGVPVLASNRIIPNSPWFLTAKIDMDEVDAPLGEWSQLIAVLTTAWMAAAGLALALVWRNRDARFYLQQYMSEAERRALSQRYEYLTKNANDIILVMDQDWRIVEVNDRAVAAYGYEREEFFNLHIWDLFQDSRWSNNGNKTLRPEDDGLRFESVCCRKDGGTFPVEISSSLIQMEDSSLYQYIVRDVAERKEKEKALKESEQQLRFLSSRLLIVQENERRRISKELHDELGHALMILKFQIGSVETKLAKSKKGLRKDCESLLQYVDVLIEDVRRLSWDLSPTVLEQFGLSIAIKNLLEEYRNHYEVHWTPAQLDEINNSFSSLSQVNIYRIFQESLTNIARHAQATQISVGVEKQNNHVAFTIADNGSGFEPRAVMSRESKDRGIGLAAMQERARLTGGRLNIWSQPGAGTKLRFTIPLDKGD